MKKLIILFLLTGCYSQEIQVRSTYAIVLEVEKVNRFNIGDRILVHLKSENNINFVLETRLYDTIYYVVGRRLPFLAPR